MPFAALIKRSTVTCNVERQTPTADATGADAPTWTARLSAIKCVIQPFISRRGSGDGGFNRDDALVHYQLFTLSDIAATTQDRINIGGIYYTVISSLPIQGLMSGERVFRTLVSKRN